ncbi:MAG: ATP-binding cassette domain-containing protein [Alphaproteobacteria bacterium]|nr:ATP-binding cassette domain-containing protein [Alphaproteobacteria bacterium]TAD90575.1 MAG: ATP-binding cassette domain-containing protein [Alphaproteobacteria bacterium]
MSALLRVEGVVRSYRLPRTRLFGPAPVLRAVDGVSFTVAAGETLAVVGESGCGKSTLARLVMALDRPDQGRVLLEGTDLAQLSERALRPLRRRFQIVFQDPMGSLNPRLPVHRIVGETLATLAKPPGRVERRARIASALESVGLAASDAARYPHEFSGGQRQRIAIARALVTEPELIVADEPVSALDLSVQAQVLNLLVELQQRRGLAYLFISHNLAVVRHLARRTAVMYAGRFVETGPTAALFREPLHPYTRTLLAAVPRLDGVRHRLPVVEPLAPRASGGCAFVDRCPLRQPHCAVVEPTLTAVAEDRAVACHLVQPPPTPL